VEILLVDAAERRPESQQRGRRIAEFGIRWAVIAQIVVGDDRALAVREENNSVVALVLDEGFEDELQAILNTGTPGPF
jgi:hypothetical protein